MTMPHERLRALAEGQDLLRDIERDEAVASALRDAARALVEAHPSSEEFRALVRDRATTLTVAQSEVVQAAGELFRAVQRDGQGREETRRFVLFTLRHYPPKILAAAWARGFYPGIDDWLALDA